VRVRAGCALLLLAGALALATGRGGGQGSFRGTATAEGVRVGVLAGGAPVSSQVVDGASPIAQAALDSTIGSSAFASVLYPGDTVVTTPGLVAGFSGGATSEVIPPYPLIAIAGSTTAPESRAEAPGTSMQAEGSDRRGSATATTGTGQGAATFTTTATTELGDDDTVVASAATEAVGVAVGPLQLGKVTARSLARRGPSGKLERESDFEVSGITVGGAAVKLTPEGLVVGETAVPLSASPLQPVLDAAKVSLRYVAEQETEDGVVSAGLVVTRTQELPGSVTPVEVSYTLGRASAAVSGVALPSDVLEQLVAPIPVDVHPDTPAASGVEMATSDAEPSAVGGGSVPAVAAPYGPGAGLPAVEAPPAPVGRTISDGPVGLFDASGFYLVLVGGALAAGAVLQFMREGRQPWT
jgi:hypothetical protein